MKQITTLVKVETLGESEEQVGKVVVTTEHKRIASIMDTIVTGAAEPRFEHVQVAAKVIGGTRKTFEVFTDQGWFKAPLKTTVVNVEYAVKKKNGTVLLVQESDLVPVYDSSIWESDSVPSADTVKTVKPNVKKASKN